MNINELVESELAPIRKKYGDDATLLYLNSFLLRLPDKRFARGGCNRYGLTDKEWTSKWRTLEYCTDKNSENFKNQTPQEFFEGTVDRTLKECGISFDEIYRLQKENKKAELCDLVLPAFIRLREMGYSIADLGYTVTM